MTVVEHERAAAAPRNRARVVAETLDRATEMAQLLDEAGLEVDVAVVRAGEARRSAGRGRRPDVLVVTDLERASDLRDLVRAEPDVPIVVIARDLRVADARRFLEAGATGLVDETDGLETLPLVVQLAAHGQLCLPRRMREVFEPISLSTRERQVLALMASGLSNPEIAEQMFISESTVKSHTASAFRRLGVHSRREAVALVLGSDETLRRTVLMSHPLEPLQRADRRDEPSSSTAA
jgi:DNA-binding NarL/FixJ family response regulator